jgi:uncharacterized protein (TIGR02145 family)
MAKTHLKPQSPTSTLFYFPQTKEHIMKTNTCFLFAASTSLALALTLSCSSDDDGGGGGCNIENYKTVKIGSQNWMAENLNCKLDDSEYGSECYDNDPTNCVKYGRLYSWATAMALPEYCDFGTTSDLICLDQVQSKHKGICPSGWHIPSDSDWEILIKYVQTDNDGIYTMGSDVYGSIAGKYLKAANGWNDYIIGEKEYPGNGEDKYGFAALPGGYDYWDIGTSGIWWSSSTSGLSFAFSMRMDFDGESAWLYSEGKYSPRSVRCVQD